MHGAPFSASTVCFLSFITKGRNYLGIFKNDCQEQRCRRGAAVSTWVIFDCKWAGAAVAVCHAATMWRWWGDLRWHRLDCTGVRLLQKKSSISQAPRFDRGRSRSRCGRLRKIQHQRHRYVRTLIECIEVYPFYGNTSLSQNPGVDGVVHKPCMGNI